MDVPGIDTVKGRAMRCTDLQRSPLRWAGSKRKLLPALKSLAPAKYHRYVEPFCGSLCLFVMLKPQRALVSDMNSDLIQFYRVMRYSADAVTRHVLGIPADEMTYYKVRGLDPVALTAAQQAARFLYLNRFCFNGVYRTNLEGRFNVARGRHMGMIPSQEELHAFGSLLKRAELRCSDFEAVLENCGDGDFVYLDPPYAGRDVRDRGEYGPGAFKQGDIERFSESVRAASDRGAKILISYADLPQIRKQFVGWDLSQISVARNVSGFVSGRQKVNELFIRNYR